MGDITTDCKIVYGALTNGTTEILIETPDTADTADTIALTLSKYGVTSFVSIHGEVQNTANSVIVDEAPTTVVSAGVLTITVGGSTVSNKKRTYKVVGK